MTLLFDRPDWFDHAACRGMGPSLFFPEQGQNGNAAKKVCAGCPVKVSCLSYSMQSSETRMYGVFGGQSERQRRRNHPAKPCAECGVQFVPGDRERMCSVECRHVRASRRRRERWVS